MIAALFLVVLALYLLCGLLFAIPFVLAGAKSIDQRVAHGSWGFRVLILPGATALWPFLLRRWVRGIHEPPVEPTAHRLAANR